MQPAAAVPTETKKPAKEKKPLTPEQTRLLPLVDEVRGLIEAHKAGMNTDREECARVLEQVIRLEKIPEDEILPLTRWAVDDHFWCNNLLSIYQWRSRSDKNGLPKIVNAHASFTKQKTAPRPMQRRIEPDVVKETRLL